MSLFMLLPTIVLFLLLFVLWRILFGQNKNTRLLAAQLEEQGLLLTTLQGKDELNEQLLNEQQNKIAELEKSIMQISEQHIEQFSEVNKQITQLKNDIAQLNDQQPEDKLYSRAFKLAALGADVEEIAQNCEIPLAEAEMLLAIHKTKAD